MTMSSPCGIHRTIYFPCRHCERARVANEAALADVQPRPGSGRKGDTYIDMSSVLSREAVSALLDGMDLLPGSQEKGSSKRHFASDEYDKRVKHVHVTTSDDAHPTDRVYRLMWTHIKGELQQQGYTFGLLS